MRHPPVDTLESVRSEEVEEPTGPAMRSWASGKQRKRRTQETTAPVGRREQVRRVRSGKIHKKYDGINYKETVIVQQL